MDLSSQNPVPPGCKLSYQERQRHTDNRLYLGCGHAGHIAINCPLRCAPRSPGRLVAIAPHFPPLAPAGGPTMVIQLGNDQTLQ